MTDEVFDVPLGMPTPARMYDYFLGGKDNFEVDRAAGNKVIEALGPDLTRGVVWENRRFLWRAVEYLAREHGIDQFIDVGAGLPTMRNTHEIAQESNPDAHVVYVDNDPIVLSHGRALLAKAGATTVVTADMRDPALILDHPNTKSLIDLSRPVALLFVAVFHFLPSPGHPRYQPGDADPGAILAAFRDRVPPGSFIALSHLTSDGPPADEVARTEEVYNSATAPIVFRSRSEVAALFRGWRMVPPGLVHPWQWHPGQDEPEEETPRTDWLWAGVAAKDE